MNKNDARYIKTHSALKRAFEQLILSSDINNISVTSITKAAGVNRRTFYLHYETVDDMYDELAIEQAALIGDYIRASSRTNPGDMYCLIRGLIDLICGNKPLHRKIICSAEYSRLFRKISDQLANDPARRLPKETDPREAFCYGLRMDSVSFTIMNSIRKWLMDGEPISVELLTETIVGMIQ